MVVAGHDTPLKLLPWAPLGLGLDWIAHVLPFQRSASVTHTPELLMEWPTATQTVAAAHETALSTVARAPVGFGVFWIAQLLPFQRSANDTGTPELLV